MLYSKRMADWCHTNDTTKKEWYACAKPLNWRWQNTCDSGLCNGMPGCYPPFNTHYHIDGLHATSIWPRLWGDQSWLHQVTKTSQTLERLVLSTHSDTERYIASMTIVILSSPHTFMHHSWCKVFVSMANKWVLRLIVNDEAHLIGQHGLTFWTQE